MFGKRTQDLDGMAKAAWHDVVDSLGSTEAGRRAGNAWDALAGRAASRRAWPMMRAAAIGVVIGWVGAEVYRRRRPQIDEAVDRVGSELREAKHTVDERLAMARDRARSGINTSPGS